MKKKTFVIGIPTMGKMRTQLVSWMNKQEGIPIMSIEVTPHAFARNLLVDAFLQTEADYLLMVDSDTVPCEGAVKMLLDVADDTTVATGVTPIVKGNSICPNVYKKTEDVEKCLKIKDKKPFEVAGCGASCIMIPRKLLEKMPKPYFKSIEFDDAKICSEDLYFCEQVYKNGGKIICDPKVTCVHFKEVGLSL
jgi:hypothetical protein